VEAGYHPWRGCFPDEVSGLIRLAPSKRRSNGSRAKQRGGVYRLPFSRPFESNSTTVINVPSSSSVGMKQVTINNLVPDVTYSDIRAIMFRTIDAEVGPFPPAAAGAPGATFQMFAYSLDGFPIALERPKQLSTVNPVRLRMRIPNWLLGPTGCASGNQVFAMQIQLPAVSTGSINIPVMLRTMGDITLPEVNSF